MDLVIAAKIDKELRERYRQLFPEDRDRIGRRAAARTLEDLLNGGERRTGNQRFTVDSDLALDYDRASRGNKPTRDRLMDRFLREGMERLE